MATSDENDRNELISQLISERQIDQEVCAEIRKLLIEGVDINYQDSNRNNNTPLHLATKKSDRKCIRLLLKYKPDLKIRNGADKTPLDISPSNKIRKLLSAASFDVVEKKFIREIEFGDLSLEWLNCLETDPAFKVLKITCCPNVPIVWKRLSQDDFRMSIAKSSHLFLIAIETQEDEIQNFLSPVDIKKPIIVQITSDVSKKPLIYCKEENSIQLIEMKFLSPIYKDDFLQRIQMEANCKLSLLVQALNSNIFGVFSGSLLGVKLNNDKDRSEIINCFAATNALCFRFFMLFNERLTEEELNARATSALTFPGDQSLLALLDMPFDFKDEVVQTDDQKQILNFVDSRNYNLTMIAIECNNRDAVKTLLRLSTDLNHVGTEGNWASDLCWDKENWDCLAELIEAGSPYPYNFDASSPSLAISIAFVKIKSAMDAAKAFHESIQHGDIDEVEEFMRNNPKMKQVYDAENKSALTVALKLGQADIYSLLLSEHFTPGIDDKYEEVFKERNTKDDIRNKNREYFRNAFDQLHLKRLLNKYKLSFTSSNRETCSQVIQNMFLTLNEIPEMVPILRIVSCSDHLNIVFDFDCQTVHEMDPSSTGLTYRSEFIYIGAKNHSEDVFDVIGILARELTHHAMQLAYENNCKPYAIDDKANQEIFKSIVNETRKLVKADPSTDSIVRTVFTLYKPKRWHQELIVRVPHLMARYKNAAVTLDEARLKNYRLFDFFLSKVLPDMKAQTKVLPHKLEIRKINSLAGTIEKIKKHEVQFKECEIKMGDQIIGSNAPQLTLNMLRQSLDEYSHIFISIEKILVGNIRKRIGQLGKKGFAIVVDCTDMVQKHEETICNIKQFFCNASEIFLVMASEETSIVTSKLINYFRVTNAQHNWSDLTDDSKDILLQKKVNFQGALCNVKDLMTSVALLDLALNEFCSWENFNIGDPLADPFDKFYLPRNFTREISKNIQIEKRVFKPGSKNIEGIIESEKFETLEKTLNEILVESKSTTVVIIADSAGTGKTSTLHEIAKTLRKNDPTRWTFLTDLKQHIEMLKKIKESDFNSFQHFVTKIFLAEKSVFEKKLFTQFYREGRTNILLDGFDEISPCYKEEVLKALKIFTPKFGNQLWITTRSHLERELEITLNQLSCSLQPLTEEAQIEFLETVWTNSSGNAIDAKDLIHKLSSICNSNSSFIGLPILISLLAEIFDDPEKCSSMKQENLSFYSIFKQFVEKKIEISISNGDIADAGQRELLLQSELVVEVHRKIAIAYFFGNEIAEINVNYEQCPVEKLTRIGLIRYDEPKKSYSFIHETFAEYFLADFIVENLKTKACGFLKILVKVFTGKEFYVVRLFLDQALKELEIIHDNKLCKKVDKQLNVVQISKESCDEIFKFMLYTIEHVKERSLLNDERDEEGDNVVLINFAIDREEMMQTIFDFMKQNTKLGIAKINIQALNDNRENNFFFATLNRNEFFSALYEYIQKILTSKDTMKMLKAKDTSARYKSVLQDATSLCNEKSLNDLVKILNEIFSNEEIREMVFKANKDDDYNLRSVIKNNKIILKCFFKHLNESLNYDETKKLIQRKGIQQKNVLHVACFKNDEVFPTLHECTIEFFEQNEIKKMLMEKDINEPSLLPVALARYHGKTSNLAKIIFKVLRNHDVGEMLDEINGLHADASEISKIQLKSFSDEIKKLSKTNAVESLRNSAEDFSGQSLKFLSPSKDLDGWSELHYACKFAKSDELTRLCEKLQFNLSKVDLKSMFTMKTNVIQLTPVMLAATNENTDVFKSFWKFVESNFDDETRKNILLEEDINKNTILHFTMKNHNESNFQLIMNMLKNNFEIDQVRLQVLRKNVFEESIWLGSCSTEMYKDTIKSVWSYLPKVFDIGVFKEILIAVLSAEKTPELMKSFILFHSNEILSFVLKHLDGEEKKQIHLLRLMIEEAQHSSIEIMKFLIEKISFELHIKKIFDPRYPLLLQQIFLERDENHQNIFHFAVLNRDPEVLKFLVSKAKQLLNTDELNNVLSEVDNQGRNILLGALKNSNKTTIDSTVEIVKKNLPDVFETMLCGFDSFGQTMMHYACSIREYIADTKEPMPQSVVKTVMDLLKANLSTEKIKDILLTRDRKGKSALYYATFVEFKFLRDQMILGDKILSDAEFTAFLAIDNLTV